MERILREEMTHPSSRLNISTKELIAMRDLRKDTNTYLPSDKGGEFTYIETTRYNELALEHLNDPEIYESVNADNTQLVHRKLEELWKKICKDRKLPPSLESRLSTAICSTQRFYFLIKTHKQPIGVRPIVSNCGGPFEKICWFIHCILLPLLKEVPAHLSNSQEALERLHSVNQPLPTSTSVFSLDVVSLYTNVPINEAIDTACHYVQHYNINTCGLAVQDLRDLLSIILHNNIFIFNNMLFRQKSGLAMGSRIAPVLAIIVLDKLEKSYLRVGLQSDPFLYIRYVDDTLVLALGDTAGTLLKERLNNLHPSIKFTLELPDEDGFVPFLDLKIAVKCGYIHNKF